MERSAGATVCGRLELLREEPSSVGVQVFGPTWVVLDSESGELARACLLDDELLPTAALRDAFVAAAAELGTLRDPALVPQLFAGSDNDGSAVLYEPVSGGVAFGELYDGTGSYELAVEVGRLARQLARALAALHQRGRVHGMLTAASVFVGPRGPSVYQYGLAPLCDRTVLMRRVRAFDLPCVAPEIHAGGPFTPSADLYAWAVTVAQFASGARGPAAIAAVQSNQELPGMSAGLRAAIQACLSESPDGRPQDASELLRRLDSVGIGELSGMMPAPEGIDQPAQPAPPAPAPAAPPAIVAPPPVAPPPPAAAKPVTPPPRPPVPKDRPPTLPPQAGMNLPVTSFEDMLLSGDRQRRPAPAPAPAPAASASRSAIELSPEDLMHESGAWTKSGQPTGKSSTALRRVHVLTDPVRRETSEGQAPVATADSKPPADLIIGGTREEVEAASRATTVKLDPVEAANAVQAAAEAHTLAAPEPGAPARSDVPVRAASSAVETRRRSSAIAVADARPEPQDWGKIPTRGHATVPPAPLMPAPTAAISLRRPPLALIFTGIGFVLLLVVIFTR